MKKLLVFVSCFVFFDAHSLAQSSDIVRVKAGEDPAKKFSPYGFYRFPTFSQGVAVFKHGGTTTAKFNYHLLNEEMQFIAANGDTLALADPFSIKYIAVDSSLYYYSDGYVEIIEKSESLKLATRLRLDIKWEKIGAYGQPSPSGSIRTPNRIILGNMVGANLTLNQDIIIQKDYTYFWLDKYGTVLKATKANLLKFLPSDTKGIVEDYVKKNNVDFRKESDLRKLFQFSLSLM